MINQISNDPTSLVFEGHIVLDQASLVQKCPLATKSDFWIELEMQKTIRGTVVYLLVQDSAKMSKELRENLDQIRPISFDNPDDVRTMLRYSSEPIGLADSKLYKLADVNKSLESSKNSNALKSELCDLVECGSLKIDKLAQIVIVPDAMTYFSRFDGVTLDDLESFFKLDGNVDGALWILNRLQESGVLERQTVQMTRLTRDDNIWKSLVECHLGKNAKSPAKEDSKQLKLMYEYAGLLSEIRNEPRYLNITKELLKSHCKITLNDDIDMLHAHLESEKILETYLYTIWRLKSKLNCARLPACIADRVDEFLADRFSYTFALEKICLSLEEANRAGTNPSPSQVFLCENPFREVFADFVNSGLAMPSRICVTTDTIDDIEFDEIGQDQGDGGKSIRAVVMANRLKLYDQTDSHMELLPLAAYVREHGFMPDSDLNNIINNGLKMVVGLRRNTTSTYLLGKVVGAFASCWNGISTVASAIGSFGYSIAKFISILHIFFFYFRRKKIWID